MLSRTIEVIWPGRFRSSPSVSEGAEPRMRRIERLASGRQSGHGTPAPHVQAFGKSSDHGCSGCFSQTQKVSWQRVQVGVISFASTKRDRHKSDEERGSMNCRRAAREKDPALENGLGARVLRQQLQITLLKIARELLDSIEGGV